MPALRAVQAETSANGAEQAAYLQDLFGPRLTAFMVGVGDPSEVDRWARGETRPDPGVERRLADAFDVAHRLRRVESAQAVRAWFVGMNPDLDDRAPADVIASEPDLVLNAATIFLATG